MFPDNGRPASFSNVVPDGQLSFFPSVLKSRFPSGETVAAIKKAGGLNRQPFKSPT
jgi:hypothetical protein